MCERFWTLPLGRVIRDVGRRIEGSNVLREVFAKPMNLARRVRDQDRHQRGSKVYSPHAPEMEPIGKGKAHRPHKFGVKVSVVTTLKRSSGGQFVAHVAALPGNSYDGHTLGTVIPAMEQMIGNTIERALTDVGYRGHNAPPAALRERTRWRRLHQSLRRFRRPRQRRLALSRSRLSAAAGCGFRIGRALYGIGAYEGDRFGQSSERGAQN
jgi:hypothetical protein